MTRIPRVLVCVTGQKSCEHLIHVGAEIAREDGAELSVGCNDSPAVVVNKVFC